MYDERYDMHITFYGDNVDVESVDYEVNIDLPNDCTTDELVELLKVAIRALIGMQS